MTHSYKEELEDWVDWARDKFGMVDDMKCSSMRDRIDEMTAKQRSSEDLKDHERKFKAMLAVDGDGYDVEGAFADIPNYVNDAVGRLNQFCRDAQSVNALCYALNYAIKYEVDRRLDETIMDAQWEKKSIEEKRSMLDHNKPLIDLKRNG